MSLFKKRTPKVQPRKRALSELDDEPESGAGDASSSSKPAGDQTEEEKVDLAELLALRKLQKSAQGRMGIDVSKLNRGPESKKRAAVPKEDVEPQHGLRAGGKDEPQAAVDEEDEEQKARKIVMSNNFTQQTNALDVDKHMMAFIENGIKKRRNEQGIIDDDNDVPPEESSYDPHEELFKIDERYKIERKAGGGGDDEDEGNVQNSMAMLTNIPEVDLGMDVRLKNIEETEKAKRLVADERRARMQSHQAGGSGTSHEPDLGSTRFFRPQQNQQSDAEALRLARLAAQGVEVPDPQQRRGNRHHGGGDRRETATDEMVMERFKKRMRNVRLSRPMADSVSLFGDGTFEEQIRELVDFLARGFAEEPRLALIRPISEALVTAENQKGFDESEDRRRRVITLVLPEVKGLGQGSEREIEGFYNLLFAHILSLYPDPAASRERISPILSILSSPTSEQLTVRYKILSNLFNALPRSSALRYDTYSILLSLATANDQIEVLQISKPSVDAWLKEWDIPEEEKLTLLKNVADAYRKAGKFETAYIYHLLRVLLLSSSSSPSSSPPSPSLTKSASLDLLTTAFHLPLTYDLHDLLALKEKVLNYVEGHPLGKLLEIFVNGDVGGWNGWREENVGAGLGEEIGLDIPELDRKIRFLTLGSLAAKNVGKDLPYSEIASALQLEGGSVESWVIDAIRAKLIQARLSQPTQTLHITRTTRTSFHPFSSPSSSSSTSSPNSSSSEWKDLERKLVDWRAGLVGVLDVVRKARENALGAGAVGGGGEKGGEEEEKKVVAHGDLVTGTGAPAGGVVV